MNCSNKPSNNKLFKSIIRLSSTKIKIKLLINICDFIINVIIKYSFMRNNKQYFSFKFNINYIIIIKFFSLFFKRLFFIKFLNFLRFFLNIRFSWIFPLFFILIIQILILFSLHHQFNFPIDNFLSFLYSLLKHHCLIFLYFII